MAPEEVPVVCLMGPTATGKTDAAAQFTETINAEIISVDSSLVYQGMDIGTAKPDAEFLQRFPHHLIDVRHPNNTYSVAEFYHDASQLIERIARSGKIPVLAGGTQFYFNALEHGIAELPVANPELRRQISAEADRLGWPALHQKLYALDAESAARIEPNDSQRIQRALEIVLESGHPVAHHNQARQPAISNPLIKVALCFSDRAELHQRIEQRFDVMLEQGLEQEVRTLLDSGVQPDTPSMKMIGYRQMLEFLQGDTTYNEMRFKGIAATRQLAKRQLTWLRHKSNLLWWVDLGLHDKEFSQLMRYLSQFLR